MLELAETLYSTLGLGGIAALWLLKAGVGFAGLRYLKQKRIGTSG